MSIDEGAGVRPPPGGRIRRCVASAVRSGDKGVPLSAADICEQCVWLLGNVAGDGPHSRDLIWSLGGGAAIAALMDALIRRLWVLETGLDKEVVVGALAGRPIPVAALSAAAATAAAGSPVWLHHRIQVLLRNLAWSASNLVRGKGPRLAAGNAMHMLQPVAMLATADDKDTCTDALWALSYITEQDDLQAVCANVLVALPPCFAVCSPLPLLPSAASPTFCPFLPCARARWGRRR